MSEIETQAIVTLQQIARALAAMGQSAHRSLLEIWGPPIAAALISMGIAVLGWSAIDRSNQKNNRYLVALQTKEFARNLMLDALDEYSQYLDDIRDPLSALVRTKAIHEKNIEVLGGGEKWQYTMDPSAVHATLLEFSAFDRRRVRWLELLSRQLPGYGPDSDAMITTLATMATRAVQIRDELNEYKAQALLTLNAGMGPTLAFLTEDRKKKSLDTIDEQGKDIKVLHQTLDIRAYVSDGSSGKRVTNSR